MLPTQNMSDGGSCKKKKKRVPPPQMPGSQMPKLPALGACPPVLPPPRALTACRLCTTGSRRRGRRRLRTAGCPSAPPAPRCSWRPRCTAGLRGKRETWARLPRSVPPPPLAPPIPFSFPALRKQPKPPQRPCPAPAAPELLSRGLGGDGGPHAAAQRGLSRGPEPHGSQEPRVTLCGPRTAEGGWPERRFGTSSPLCLSTNGAAFFLTLFLSFFFFFFLMEKHSYLLLTSFLSPEVIGTASHHGRKTQVEGDS